MAIKGCIVGDILGSVYEFGTSADFDYKTVNLYDKNMTFTDDTIMALAVKKAVLNNKDYSKYMIELGKRYIDIGFGSNFYIWLTSENHRQYNSYGNGSAMRIAFIGEYYDDLIKCQKEAICSALPTHNHPEGIKGAKVTATCIWMAKHGKTKEQIYQYVLDEYPSDKYAFSVNKSLDELRENYIWSETCPNCVPVAVRCFYESEDYESFIRNVISLNCDADTIAAIGGGVTEEYYHGFGNIKADDVINYCLDDYLLSILND
ncbi:MAG: ADP-ribosylglycohydrolase family protein [Candidatus Riflebacteria bacterium]|nr:ADP-ribosylglycohydrolase family protein [Candidatus Riflebacteria bacterium]